MYKTMQAFERAFPRHYLGTDGVELVEYAEVVRCKDCDSFFNKLNRADGSFLCHWCSFHDDQVKPEDFCSYGTRESQCD
jgi:hypothetical protein